jgi:hypothetical protein
MESVSIPSSELKASRITSFAGGINDTMMPLKVAPSTLPKIVSDIQTTIGSKEL